MCVQRHSACLRHLCKDSVYLCVVAFLRSRSQNLCVRSLRLSADMWYVLLLRMSVLSLRRHSACLWAHGLDCSPCRHMHMYINIHTHTYICIYLTQYTNVPLDLSLRPVWDKSKGALVYCVRYIHLCVCVCMFISLCPVRTSDTAHIFAQRSLDFHRTATHCHTLQHVAAHCNTLMLLDCSPVLSLLVTFRHTLSKQTASATGSSQNGSKNGTKSTATERMENMLGAITNSQKLARY